MITIKQITDYIYETILKSWWASYKCKEPATWVPSVGLIVYSNGNPIIAGFIYRMDAPVAIVDFIVSDPESSDEDKKNCYPVLLASLEGIARERGVKHILTFTQHQKWMEKLEAFGFSKIDNMKYFSKDLL